jgi:hypothetical protein
MLDDRNNAQRTQDTRRFCCRRGRDKFKSAQKKLASRRAKMPYRSTGLQ